MMMSLSDKHTVPYIKKTLCESLNNHILEKIEKNKMHMNMPCSIVYISCYAFSTDVRDITYLKYGVNCSYVKLIKDPFCVGIAEVL